MRLLTFQAKRFAWRPYARTLAQAAEADAPHAVADAVVAFIQVERADIAGPRAASACRQALKHLKWLANKRGLRTVVLHSFTHLGGDAAEPAQARERLEDLAERLRVGDYTVHITPFGWVHEWDLHVFGESLAKVWKQI